MGKRKCLILSVIVPILVIAFNAVLIKKTNAGGGRVTPERALCESTIEGISRGGFEDVTLHDIAQAYCYAWGLSVDCLRHYNIFDRIRSGSDDYAIVEIYVNRDRPNYQFSNVSIRLGGGEPVPIRWNNLYAICTDDTDGDGLFDYEDNCPLDRNPSQEDEDSDGVGDACEPECIIDSDCGAGMTCVARECVAAPPPPPECAADSDCGDGNVCIEGECSLPPPVTCDDDTDCDEGKVCREGECVPEADLSVVCTTDTECSAGSYCNPVASACAECPTTGAVSLVCLGGEMTSPIRAADGTYRCLDSRTPVCPVNSTLIQACGKCTCTEGYHASWGRLCVDDFSRPCPSGFALNTQDQTCIDESLVEPPRAGSKKGGCSLRR